MGEIEQVKRISIQKYLEDKGYVFENDYCSSPFSRDTNWSFKYYGDTNSYYDWSGGGGGDIIDLVQKIEKCSFGEAIEILQKYPDSFKLIHKREPNGKVYTNFDYTNYINTDEEEIAEIINYAHSRRIYTGFYCGVFFTKEGRYWVRNPSMMYVHVNEHGVPCGAKFRKVRQSDIRFSARGRLGIYILESFISTYEQPTMYLVESESSANSLWEHAKQNKRSVVVISFGSVGSKAIIPDKYKDIVDRRLIIDYDGSEEKYQERLNHFKLDGVRPLKLKLPKGEDINSLYCQGKLDFFNNIIF